ncbi:MAG: sugar phosphate isomerase/epimerase [Anaerolineaceae bacterium]|nr:sugar phosphate isomerase/epimerase [Anaerolineaceae bacterium]
MSTLFNKLGIQTYCFRVYQTQEELIDALKECGIRRMELWPGHYNPAERDDHKQFLLRLANESIQISTFGVVGFSDETVARKTFEFACESGFNSINADFKEDQIELVEKLCEEYDKKVTIHNHGRKHIWGPVYALEHLFKVTSANIGLCLDTAWMLDSGGDPLVVAQQFRERLYGVHLKDFVFDRAGKPEDVIIGTGNLDLTGLLAYLDKTNFDGTLTLEYEGDYNDPIPATKKCVAAVQDVCAKL